MYMSNASIVVILDDPRKPQHLSINISFFGLGTKEKIVEEMGCFVVTLKSIVK